jgi:hypothetical protein
MSRCIINGRVREAGQEDKLFPCRHGRTRRPGNPCAKPVTHAVAYEYGLSKHGFYRTAVHRYCKVHAMDWCRFQGVAWPKKVVA